MIAEQTNGDCHVLSEATLLQNPSILRGFHHGKCVENEK